MSDQKQQDATATAHEFVKRVSTMTLATSAADGAPWAATVFFVADPALNLYFVSDHRTQHGRDVAENAHAAAAINPDCDNWLAVQGLQIGGRVDVVTGVERAQALVRYLKKFPQIDALFAAPKGEHEETIAKRLQAANFYKLTPSRIRVIDNARGFGWRVELEL